MAKKKKKGKQRPGANPPQPTVGKSKQRNASREDADQDVPELANDDDADRDDADRDDADRDDADAKAAEADDALDDDAESSPADADATDSVPPPLSVGPPGVKVIKRGDGAPWANVFVRIDAGWTWFESRLLFVVLIALVAAMTLWISLNGLASPMQTDNSAGTVFRALLGCAVLGGIARVATRKVKEPMRSVITAVAVVLGIVLAPMWRESGVEYWGRVLNWLQEGSSLTLFGGLRGVATRLTILLALVGASLAAGSGKHINIDVVLRFLKPKLRVPVHIIGAAATAVVCFAASWGFFDYVSIEGFGQNSEATASEKVSHVGEQLGEQFFIWRVQAGLDMSAAVDVLGGTAWDDEGRMTGREWNTLIEEAGYRDYFDQEEIESLLAPESALDTPRVPFVVMPGHSTRGLMIHGLNLMWCVGLFFIGLRVTLRAILVAGGHAPVEPDPDEFEEVLLDSDSAPSSKPTSSVDDLESDEDSEAEGPISSSKNGGKS